MQGVPEGSVLALLLFNLFLCDKFFIVEEVDIMRYVDDDTPYVCSIQKKIEKVRKILFEWFSNNFLNVNADKFYLILGMDELVSININNEVIKNSNYKKLLVVNLNNRLGFDTHVINSWNRVTKKLHAFAKILQFMSIHKRKMTIKAFSVLEFGYCSLPYCQNRF